MEVACCLQSTDRFDILEMEMGNVRSIRVVILAALLVLSLSQPGCSVFSTIGGWFSQGYENTVAYFNAYYNAKRLFDEAEAEALSAQSAAKPATTPGAPAGTTVSTPKQKFNAVIDKCSNILSFYPGSSVVDDALFLIGKSFFYMEDYVKAERKFTELMAQNPTGRLALDGQLWLLKTLQRMNRYDDAMRVGQDLSASATTAGRKKLAGEALAVLGDLALSQDKKEAAIDFYSKSVATTDDAAMQAATQSKIGDLYFSSAEYDKAAQAYLDVQTFAPDDRIFFDTQLQAANAYRSMKNFDSALQILRKLESDYRFFDSRGAIRFELGTTLAQNGQLNEAVDVYRLADTLNARTEAGARSSYELGMLLQYQIGNYKEAKTAFSHALVGGPADLTQEAQRSVTALDRYFGLQKEYSRFDSILKILNVDSLWVARDSSAFFPRKDSLRTARDTSKSPPSVVLRRIPKPKKDSLMASIGSVYYRLGELFYSDFEVPDSTFYWVNRAIKLGLDSVKAPRALYVLAEVARGDEWQQYGDEKDLYKEILAKYPKSAYAEEARLGLGLPPTIRKGDPATQVFAVAESLMYAGRYKPALDSLDHLVHEFAESPLVPKSRYAMAWIYENELANPDSALSQYKTLADKFVTTKYGLAAQRRIPPPEPVAPPATDSAKKAPVDKVRKSAADSTKRALPDTSKIGQVGTVSKPPVDTTRGEANVRPVKPDTTKGLWDLDEVKKLPAAVADSLERRRGKRPVIRE
jgi:tetratricopeptide (TPR) repeat protein